MLLLDPVPSLCPLFARCFPQLDAKDAESDASSQELRSLAARLSASEAERMKLQVT